MPTGSGKSLTAVAEALITGRRTLILTKDKGLQTQYAREFGRLLVDIRGKNNYICNASEKGGPFEREYLYPVSVDEAPCQFGESCPLKQSGIGCTYYDLVATAKTAPLVLGNYALWIALNQIADGGNTLGRFDLIVCDEAHELIASLTQALSVELTQDELDGLRNCTFPTSPDPAEWTLWANYWLHHINDELSVVGTRKDLFSRRRALTLTKLLRHFTKLSKTNADWIVTRSGRTAKVRPVWPQEMANEFVFGGADKVVLLSATIRPETLDLLGIARTDADYFTYPSRFPKENRPVYWMPTIRMHYANTDSEVRQWVARVDQIIAGRLDRKGIIHSVSFARQQQLLKFSKYAHLMFANPKGSSQLTQEIVNQFKAAPSPAILVSPSVDTGFDFAGDLAEYIVIVKVPWPDTTDELTKARIARNADYIYYETAQTIVQMAGRAMRFADDRCETIITDESFKPFLRKYRHLFPDWFGASMQQADTIPQPPRKL